MPIRSRVAAFRQFYSEIWFFCVFSYNLPWRHFLNWIILLLYILTMRFYAIIWFWRLWRQQVIVKRIRCVYHFTLLRPFSNLRQPFVYYWAFAEWLCVFGGGAEVGGGGNGLCISLLFWLFRRDTHNFTFNRRQRHLAEFSEVVAQNTHWYTPQIKCSVNSLSLIF